MLTIFSISKGPSGRVNTRLELVTARHNNIIFSHTLDLESETHLSLKIARNSNTPTSLEFVFQAEKTRYIAMSTSPMKEVASEINSKEHSSISDSDVLDPEIDQEELAVTKQNSSGLSLPSTTYGHQSTIISPTSDMQHRSADQVASKRAHGQPKPPRHPPAPAEKPPNLIKQFKQGFRYFVASSGSEPVDSDVDQLLCVKEQEIRDLKKALLERENIIRTISETHKQDTKRRERLVQDALEEPTQSWISKEKDLLRQIELIKTEHREAMGKLENDVREIKSQRDVIQEQCDMVIRQYQEESFKQMESARWLPSEESKVVGDLDRIRRDMRAWAKGTSIKDMSRLQELDGVEYAALLKDLSYVALLENNQLPQGLSTPKSPSLLLNALLAHDIFSTIFRNPFFFLNDGLGHELPRAAPEDTLNEIYKMAQNCKFKYDKVKHLLIILANQEDAHIWRSQTLRLLLPPLRADSKEGEKELHSVTEGAIAHVSEQQASHFAASPARYLIDTNVKHDYIKKLYSIYQEAATISYRLWTRRTAMKCYTLHNMKNLAFDIDDPNLVPHTLVHPDEHEDQLKGRTIALIVHPLLRVYGTDEAKNYHKGRVWAPAEVWFDTR
jgi:hypothetical protein